MLRNLQQPDGEPELKPIVHNKTRWSGKYYMLDRFVAIRDQLVQGSDTEGLELDMNPSRAFLEKALKYKNQLKHIQYVTKYLQTNQLKLCDCRMALDMLKENIENHQDTVGHDLEGCTLRDVYVSETADILPDPNFESGVTKIQMSLNASMTNDEKNSMH